jgi:hypothetical protein
VQGFHPGEEGTTIHNLSGHSQKGLRSIAIHYERQGSAAIPVFILPAELDMQGYKLIASPCLYSGQVLKLGMSADQKVQVRTFIHVYNERDELDPLYGPAQSLAPGTYEQIEWTLPSTRSQPIAEVGLQCQGESGTIFLDYLTWEGAPHVVFKRPLGDGKLRQLPKVWQRAWVDGVDLWETSWPEAYRLVQNSGRGLIIQGTREWTDYVVEAAITPWMVKAGGIAARVQGMRRFYALLLRDGNNVQLLKALDGDTVLAEASFDWQVNQEYCLRLQVTGTHMLVWIDDHLIFDVHDGKNHCWVAVWPLSSSKVTSSARP